MISLTGESRAIAGGAINVGVTSAGFTVYFFQLYRRNPQPALLAFALLSLLIFLGCIGLFFYSRRFAFQDTRPTPRVVRVSFGVFALALLLTATALILQTPNIFPWPLGPETSVLYGLIFLGNMCYFLYGLAIPVWGNARGQLLAFLAYDLVLLAPFLAHFPTVQPEMRLSLQIYMVVILYSALLAIHFLLIHRPTRFRMRGQAVEPQKAG